MMPQPVQQAAIPDPMVRLLLLCLNHFGNVQVDDEPPQQVVIFMSDGSIMVMGNQRNNRMAANPGSIFKHYGDCGHFSI